MESMQSRLKVHRRTLVLGGSTYAVLSPRPNVEARFATNQSHDTWHIVTDVSGAHLLATLCWAMAFQRHARTVLVIDPPLLVPNPFDGDPPAPIVIVNDDLGPFDHEAAASLRAALPFRSPSEGTVVLQTRGLHIALSDLKEFERREDQAQLRNAHQKRRWIDGSAGLMVLASPPPVLRKWGVDLSGLGSWSRQGSSWAELDYPQQEGEVQVLQHFTERVEKAVEIRNRLFPAQSGERLTEDDRRQILQLIETERSVPRSALSPASEASEVR
jgi:hypothetical protein